VRSQSRNVLAARNCLVSKDFVYWDLINRSSSTSPPIGGLLHLRHMTAKTHMIRRLPAQTVNRIAAGEVIERPASVIKELVENALDAGASQVDIRYEDGGRTVITVTDDGKGMDPENLSLAVERHATSKLPDDSDLLNIETMGFRGEALPSIGSVARLSLTSQTENDDSAWELRVDGGAKQDPRPAPRFGLHGTRVDVRDLFFATPARLKFMKSERSESMAISDVVKRLAMANPHVGFTLTNGARTSLRMTGTPLSEDGRLVRLSKILGDDFGANAVAVDSEREGIVLTGFAGLPTFSRGNSAQMDGLYGISCCTARCAGPIRISSHGTVIRLSRSMLTSRMSMSM